VSSKRRKIHVGQVVLGGHGILFENVGDRLRRVGGLGEGEGRTVEILAEGDDIDSLAVLGNAEVLAVENLRVHIVAQLFKRLADHLERAAPVVMREPLDVLAENHARLVLLADFRNVEEERAAAPSLVVVVESHAFAGHGEGLARESRQTDVEVGNRLLRFGKRDVAVDLRGFRKIGRVGLLRREVPFRYENGLDAVAEGAVESQADAADPGEEVNAFQSHSFVNLVEIVPAEAVRRFRRTFCFRREGSPPRFVREEAGSSCRTRTPRS
jgi:hypothetical protein